MELIDLIKDRNFILELKKDLVASGVPNVLYGAGMSANYIFNYLTSNGVHVDAVAIDNEYVNSETTDYLEGNKVYSIGEIINKYTSINLFIGFYENNLPTIVRQKIENIAKQGLNIEKVYMVDPSLVIHPERKFTYKFVIDNIDVFEWLFNILADQESRDVLAAFLNQRISMQIGELDYLRNNEIIYFPESIIILCRDEIYIDCGAYNGDTVQSFINAIQAKSGNSYQKIYALEPDYSNYQELANYCKQFKNIITINKGAWSKVGTVKFQGSKKKTSMINESGEDIIDVTALDSMLSGSKATYIKMDIQGAEYEALKGAKKTIGNYMPKLAICVYHKNEDLLTIPRYLYEINPKYNFYLRAHQSLSGEVVLYCT